MKSFNIQDQNKKYHLHFHKLAENNDTKTSAELSVGGDFDRIGKIEFALLKKFGLKNHHSIIDVGCGSGRLAKEIPINHSGGYTGTDVVPELIAHAKSISQNKNLIFEIVEDIKIPVPDSSADYICFFSVFTHLLHEQTYKYLMEAKRVLRRDGTIILSFLEFRIKSHWTVFEHNVKEEQTHLNMFMDRDAITMWAHKLNLEVYEFLDGDQKQVELYKGIDSLGQSVAILKG